MALRGRPALVGPEAGDEGDPAGLGGRVGPEDADEADEVGGVGGGPDLDADGVAHAAEELDVGVVELARAVPDPEKVAGGVVVPEGRVAGACVCVEGDAGVGAGEADGHGLLVVEVETLVGDEKVDGLKYGVVRGAAGAHKVERVQDAGDHALELGLVLRVAHEAELPVRGVAEVGELGREQGADVVEGGGGVEVALHEAVRVRVPTVAVEAVDVVAAKGWNLLAVDHLGVLGARLGVLAGHAADADGGDPRAPGEHEGHLQQDAQLALDGQRRAVGKALGAVAALEEESLALGNFRELLAQPLDLVRRAQRRERTDCVSNRSGQRARPRGVRWRDPRRVTHARTLLDRVPQRGRILVVGLLRHRNLPPRRRIPAAASA